MIPMKIKIRLLTENDYLSADNLLGKAFQSAESSRGDLIRYQALQPDGWFVAEINKTIVGMVGAVDFGSFAYIGMMAVEPELQNRGIGRQLMQHLLNWLDERGTPTSLLDATNAGFPLYQKVGFTELGQVHLYQLERETSVLSARVPVQPFGSGNLAEVCELDRTIFGAPRHQLFIEMLHEFPGRTFLACDKSGQITGFLIVQQRKIGPWVAKTREAAESLLVSALNLSFSKPPLIVIPTTNLTGIELLELAGFRCLRTIRHMCRGPCPNAGGNLFLVRQVLRLARLSFFVRQNDKSPSPCHFDVIFAEKSIL